MSSRKAVHGLTYSPTLDNGGLVVGNEVEITLDVEMIVPPGNDGILRHGASQLALVCGVFETRLATGDK